MITIAIQIIIEEKDSERTYQISDNLELTAFCETGLKLHIKDLKNRLIKNLKKRGEL